MNIHALDNADEGMLMRHPQEYAILGLLMRGNRHGYEIHRDFCSGLGQLWYAGMSQIYALLKRLEVTGKVTCKVETQDNRPAKKVYSITPEGREEFLSWFHAPVQEVRNLRLYFLAKLFFIKELKLPDISEVIARQIEVCQRQLERIKQQDKLCRDEFDHLVFQFRICQIEAILKWLHDCEKYLSL